MAFKPFRILFLNLFLNKDELESFQNNDFQTQNTLELNNFRPYITVSNDAYEILKDFYYKNCVVLAIGKNMHEVYTL